MKKNYLTTENFEDFLKEAVFDNPSAAETLALGRWEFFDPYSLICLLLLSRHLGEKKSGFHLSFGPQNPALSYLAHIGFFDQLARTPAQTDAPAPAELQDAPTILLKVTPIEQREDITDALQRLMATTETILRDHLSYTPQDTSLFLGAFAEVAQNILDHSGDKGLAAAQVYTTKKGSRFAAIAVGDLGIGIRASLSPRYPKILFNDAIAIRKAFDPAVSRFQNRGWGLTQVRTIAEKYNGTLWVRSGQGLVKFHRQFSSCQTHFFPGTQISIYLEAKKW